MGGACVSGADTDNVDRRTGQADQSYNGAEHEVDEADQERIGDGVRL